MRLPESFASRGHEDARGHAREARLLAGANCLPAALLFLGLGALAFVALPRTAAGIAYALVGVGFLWETLGALIDVPKWLLDLSPFHHIGLVPAEPFHAAAAVVMVAFAALAATVAVWGFKAPRPRRHLNRWRRCGAR